MAMRYIIRRTKPEDLSDIKTQVSNLDSVLEKATDGARKTVPVTFNNLDYLTYQFQTRKVGTDFIWVCPTIELVAGDEKALFALTDKFKLPIPAHLAHLKNA